MKLFSILCMAGLLVGCGGIELSTPEETRLTGDYHYLWNYDSTPSQLQIGRRTSKSGYLILIENVVAYGWTNGFIITKSKPVHANTGVTNGVTYTILKINKGEPAESIFGNLTHEDYVRRRKELAIPAALTFVRNRK